MGDTRRTDEEGVGPGKVGRGEAEGKETERKGVTPPTELTHAKVPPTCVSVTYLITNTNYLP